MLRTLRLRRDDKAGRDVSDANSRFDFVHVLSAFAAGTKSIDAKFVRRNLNVRGSFFDFRNCIDARETGVAPFVGIEWRNAHQPMHAAFGFAKAVGIFAFDQQRDAFDSGGFAFERIRHFDFPAARFAPALIHAQQHARPIAGFRSARAGVDAEDAIIFVVRAVEENFQFARVEFAGEIERDRVRVLFGFLIATLPVRLRPIRP